MHEEIKVKVSKEMKVAIDKAIRMGLFRDQEELLTKAILEKLKKIGMKPKQSDVCTHRLENIVVEAIKNGGNNNGRRTY